MMLVCCWINIESIHEWTLPSFYVSFQMNFFKFLTTIRHTKCIQVNHWFRISVRAMVLKNPFVDHTNNAIDYWWELQALEPQVYYNTFYYYYYYYYFYCVNATTKATEIS